MGEQERKEGEKQRDLHVPPYQSLVVETPREERAEAKWAIMMPLGDRLTRCAGVTLVGRERGYWSGAGASKCGGENEAPSSLLPPPQHPLPWPVRGKDSCIHFYHAHRVHASNYLVMSCSAPQSGNCVLHLLSYLCDTAGDPKDVRSAGMQTFLPLQPVQRWPRREGTAVK